jgi:hypothetical protein
MFRPLAKGVFFPECGKCDKYYFPCTRCATETFYGALGRGHDKNYLNNDFTIDEMIETLNYRIDEDLALEELDSVSSDLSSSLDVSVDLSVDRDRNMEETGTDYKVAHFSANLDIEKLSELKDPEVLNVNTPEYLRWEDKIRQDIKDIENITQQVVTKSEDQSEDLSDDSCKDFSVEIEKIHEDASPVPKKKKKKGIFKTILKYIW